MQIPKNERSEIERLEGLINKYERGKIQHIDWLDRLTCSALEKAMKKKSGRIVNLYPSLIVELYSFDHKVIFQVSITHHCALFLLFMNFL
jgi:phosphatidylinositol 3-kinase